MTSGFNRKSTAEQVTEGVDLTGRTVLITGVASGLGFEAMRVLAKRGAVVIGLDRDIEATKTACQKIGDQAVPIACDLSDPNSIVTASDAISDQFKSIDVILTNAGVMSPPYTVIDHYKEPVELQFAVNFLGHFILINRLMPLVQAGKNPRIALVASEGYVTAPKKTGIDFDDLAFLNKKYDGLESYGQSKLAVMLKRIELARRLECTGITCNTVHPGVIRTNLANDTTDFKVKLISLFAGPWTRSIAQGAATHCFVAAHPSLDGVSGKHYADCNEKDASGHAVDAELAERLWDKAMDLAAPYLKADNIFG